MIKIAICDDEPLICKEIAEIIENHSAAFIESIHISVYLNGESLYEDLGNDHDFDLIFLDIELYKINGVDIGHFIRKTLDDQLTQIVYISAKQNYAMDLFSIHPLHFLVKPLDREKVIRCLELTLKMSQREIKYFSYQMKGAIRRIPLSDIYYFESNARRIKIVFVGGEDTFYGKLNDIYEQIRMYPFLYIHKSYIVNYLRVNVSKSDEMILENGKTLPVSRSMHKVVFKKITEIRTGGTDSWV